MSDPAAALKVLQRLKAEESFAEFVKQAWPVLEPSTKLKWGWVMDTVCEHLQASYEGKILRLLINIPPGLSKSMLTSVLFPAWVWVQDPTFRILTASYSEALSLRDSRKMRALVTSDWFQENWPHVKLDPEHKSAGNFATTKTGFRIATSVGGTATGQRGDLFVIDDPISVGQADSESEREKALMWFTETLPTRINDPETSRIVLIMQRVHEMDPAGHVIRAYENWDKLILPLEYEKDHPYKSKTTLGFVDPRTEDGELLFPERYSREYIEGDLKPQLTSFGGDYAVAGQLQQRPSPRGGGIFKADNFNIIRPTEVPEGLRWCRGWDLAASTGSQAAYTSGCLMAIDDDMNVYIRDVVRKRCSPRDVEKLILHCAETDPQDTVQDLPQDPGQAGKAQKAHMVRLLAGHDVRFGLESGSKEDRARPLASALEGGILFLVEGPWNQPFIAEAATFPAGRYKDQIDAASRAYARLIPKKRYSRPVAPELIGEDDID